MTRLSKRISAAVCVSIVLGIVGPTTAGASLTQIGSFGTAGTGKGQFSGPGAIAANNATGDVYVLDSGNFRVQQFDSAGSFIRMFGKRVNQTSEGDVCPRPGNPADVCKAGESGGAAGAFSSGGALSGANGIAIDNSGGPAQGSVYIQDSNNKRIQRFTADGQFVLTWGKGVNQTTGGKVCTAASGDTCKAGVPTTEVGGFAANEWFSENLAVDSGGYVYTESGSGGEAFGPARIQKFDSGGSFVSQVLEPGGAAPFGAISSGYGLAVDATGHVYFAFPGTGSGGSDKVIKFSPSDFTPSGDTGFFDFILTENSTTTTIALDPTNQYLFSGSNSSTNPCDTGSGSVLMEHHPGGALVDCTDSAALGGGFITAIGVSASHKLYMAVGNQVRIFAAPASSAPALGTPTPSDLTVSGVVIRVPISGNLADTEARVEFGTEPCSSSTCELSDPVDAGASVPPKSIAIPVKELEADTTYHFRVIADNGIGGPVTGTEGTFHTYPAQAFDPSCPNTLARQQTGAAFLLDCRAYELVSAEYAGGYNVESNLIGGETPFEGFPEATDRALYALHNGIVPGVAGKPNNRGPDPYIAVRDPENERWRTEYVGIPADVPSTEPFSPGLLGAGQGLDSFAFGGADICDPCFPDASSGIPVHRPDGTLAQGMVGSEPVADPQSAGQVEKHLSADGDHLVFGSAQKFEPDGNDSGTDVTIYERDLEAGTTQAVSTLPSGDTIEDGDDVVALDVSADGSRVLIGDRVSEDALGNSHYDLYMHVGNSPNSLPVADTAAGVQYAGSTADLGTVYFAGRANLADDTDSSVDLFEATVGGGVTVERVSSGQAGTGNTDSCDPSANSFNTEDWNTIPGGPTDCSIVALGGGAGVAGASGAIYFLSPEQLDGGGVDGSPNLFLAPPGDEPRFVSTLESSNTAPLGPPAPKFDRFEGSFKKPLGAAIDRSDGSYYVYDAGESFLFVCGCFGDIPDASVHKFDANGDPVAGFGTAGVLSGFWADGLEFFGPAAPTSIAVDNNPAHPNHRDLFVLDTEHSQAESKIKRYSSTGTLEATIEPFFANDFYTSVALDPVNGKVFVTARNNNFVFGYEPSSSGLTIPSAFIEVDPGPNGIAVDSHHQVYVTSGGAVKIYDGETGAPLGTLDPGPAKGLSVDPGSFADPDDDIVYVDRGDSVVSYDSDGDQLGTIGSGTLTGSVSLAVDLAKLVASDPGGPTADVALFEPSSAPDRAYDHPLVLHSVGEAGTRFREDFQTNVSGEQAVFPSILSLDGSGYDTAGRYELFRYDAGEDRVDCASCDPTGRAPAGDAALPRDGLGVTDDGRVFFNTREALVLRDVNKGLDAYQWSPRQPSSQLGACLRDAGCTQLISTGTDSSDSGMLSVTADGTDAFFFTRGTLAGNDENGSAMKLYSARVGGGFFQLPPHPACAASDECHGPGTKATAPPGVGTNAGIGGNFPQAKKKPKCKRGKVRRGGRCVPKKKGSKKRRHKAGNGGGK